MKNTNKTKHFEKRLQQRGIPESMIRLVHYWGVESGDRISLGRKTCEAVLDELDRLMEEIC